MKKYFYLSVITLLISNLGFSQELIQNGDFSLPNDGKSYAKIDSIPNWCTDATTGSENGREFDGDNAVAWAWDEGASIYQVVGLVPSTRTKYAISLDATCYYSWWSDYTTDLYVIFSAFAGTDTTNRAVIDTVKFTVSCLSADWGKYSTKSDTYVLAAGNAHAGEHLAIEIKMFKSTDFGYGSSYTYLHYDNVSVIASDATGITEKQNNSLKLFPVPVFNTLNLTCDKTIENVVFYNITGEKVKRVTCGNKRESVDVSDLPMGVYAVSVKTSDGLVITKRVVKK